MTAADKFHRNRLSSLAKGFFHQHMVQKVSYEKILNKRIWLQREQWIKISNW